MLRCYLGWAYRGLVDFLPGSYTVKNCWVSFTEVVGVGGPRVPDATRQLRPCRGCWRPTAAARDAEAPPPPRCTAGSCPHPLPHRRSGGLRKSYRSLNLSGSHTARDFSATVSSSRSGDHLPPARCSTEWRRSGRRRVLCLRRR